MKKVAQFILLSFAIGAIGYWAWDRFAETTATAEVINAPESTSSTSAVIPSDNVTSIVVTYFTTNVRCESCRTIESLARSAVTEGFAKELTDGKVAFQTINLDEPQNEHFAKDYDMSFKTVVVSEETSERVLRWRKLDEVWSLLSKPEAFKAYIAKPVREFLGPQS